MTPQHIVDRAHGLECERVRAEARDVREAAIDAKREREAAVREQHEREWKAEQSRMALMMMHMMSGSNFGGRGAGVDGGGVGTSNGPPRGARGGGGALVDPSECNALSTAPLSSSSSSIVCAGAGAGASRGVGVTTGGAAAATIDEHGSGTGSPSRLPLRPERPGSGTSSPSRRPACSHFVATLKVSNSEGASDALE